MRSLAPDAFLISTREKGELNRLTHASSPNWINCWSQKGESVTAKFLQIIYIEWKNGTLNNLNYSTFDTETKVLDPVAFKVQNGKIND